MKKTALNNKLDKLKKEAIKKMQEQGVYKGPADVVIKNGAEVIKPSDLAKKPEDHKIDTQIKISAKNLKEYLKLNKEKDEDLDLKSLFEDMPVETEKPSDEDIDMGAIDRLLSELEEEEVAEPATAEEATTELSKLANEEKSPEVKAKIKNILTKVKKLKKTEKLNEETVEEVEEVAEETKSPEVAARLKSLTRKSLKKVEKKVDTKKGKKKSISFNY